jgi:hypothetical protein
LGRSKAWLTAAAAAAPVIVPPLVRAVLLGLPYAPAGAGLASITGVCSSSSVEVRVRPLGGVRVTVQVL